MASDVNKDLEELRAEVSSLRADLAHITDTLKKLTGDAFTDARNRSRETAKETWSTLEREVEERPLTSAVAAFGIGFALGKLLDR